MWQSHHGKLTLFSKNPRISYFYHGHASHHTTGSQASAVNCVATQTLIYMQQSPEKDSLYCSVSNRSLSDTTSKSCGPNNRCRSAVLEGGLVHMHNFADALSQCGLQKPSTAVAHDWFHVIRFVSNSALEISRHCVKLTRQLLAQQTLKRSLCTYGQNKLLTSTSVL